MSSTLDKRMTILPITVPILIENVLHYVFSFTDMFMVSGLVVGGVRYGDDAVAAVGLCGSFVFFINIFITMVIAGAGIVTTQYLGAKQAEKAGRTVMTSTVLITAVGTLLSVFMFSLTRVIIGAYGLSPVRASFAGDYLTIYGSFSIVIAFNSGFSTILRSYGYTRHPMIINAAANVLNIFGNIGFIYGAFGFPQWGVAGVAVSTVVSQALAAAVMFFFILRKKEIGWSFRRFRIVTTGSMKEILKIGVPTGTEYLLYSLAGMVLSFFVVRMDEGLPPAAQVNLPAYNYAFLFSRFIANLGKSVGQGTQIVTGYLVGAGRKEEAYRKVLKYFYVAFGLAAALTGVVSLLRRPLLGIFPMDKNIFELATTLILMCMALETGRTFNLVIISALKGAGDVRFPVMMGVISMWGIGVLGGFLFGLVLHWGVVGIWLGIACDEWTRGIIMFFRWRSKVWQTKRATEVPALKEEAFSDVE
ncbi:MAG: MATE family efflux transporter [Spirochaetales bacterium]|nr:MATE family efflux transporter [Spirochaetales bacterium]